MNLNLYFNSKLKKVKPLQKTFYLILPIYLILACNNYTESQKKVQATLGLLSQKSKSSDKSHFSTIQNKTIKIDLKTGISSNLRKSLVFKVISKNEKGVSFSSKGDSWKNINDHSSITVSQGESLQFGIINQSLSSSNIFSLEKNGLFTTEKPTYYFSLNDLPISNNEKKQTYLISLILTIQSLDNFENFDKVTSKKEQIVKIILNSQLYSNFESDFKKLIPSISHKVVNFSIVQEESQNQKFAQTSAKNKSTNPNKNLLPSKPQKLKLVKSDTNLLKVSWKSSIDLDGKIEHYEVSIHNKIWKNIGLVNSYQFQNLSPSSQYTIKVKSMDNSKEYSPISAITQKTQNKKPTTPQDLNIQRNNKNITLSWKASQDESGKITDYEVSLNSSAWISTKNLLNYTFTNLLLGNLYEFRVRAKDNENAYSSIATRSYTLENQIPTNPPNFKVTNTSETNIQLSWDSSIDFDGTIQNYEIRKNDSDWIILGLEQNHSFKNLIPSSNYTFQIRAKDNENTHSANSSITHKTDNAIPTSPSNLTATISHSYVRLQWNESSDIGNGHISDYEVKLDTKSWTSTKNQNIYTFSNLRNGKNYTLKVRAKDNENAYSLESILRVKTLSSYLKHFNTNANVNSIDFAPHKNQFLIGTKSNIQIWNLTDSSPIKIITEHSGEITSVKYSKDGSKFISAGKDGKIKVWKNDGTFIKTLTGHTKQINMIDINQDGKIISASDDTKIKIWDINGTSTTSIQTIDPIGSPKFKSVAFSQDEQFFVAGDTNRQIRIWNTKTRIQEKPTLNTDHQSSIYSVIFSKDNKKIISGSYDKTIKIWDNTTQTITLIKTLENHGIVQQLALSPSGEDFASASSNKTIKIWKLSTGKLIRTLNKHTDGVYSVSYSKDGSKILTGGSDKKVRLWNAN